MSEYYLVDFMLRIVWALFYLVRAISHKHMNDAEKVNVSILAEWIAGMGKYPVAWETITETMRETELAVLHVAEEIEAAKLQTKTQFSE